MKKILFASFALLGSLTGCIYKMPSDDHFSTLPVTNNPTVSRERPHSFPGQN